MNLLRALGIGGKPAAVTIRENLPEINSFVDVAVGGDHRRRESVSIDELGSDTFSTRALGSFKVGGIADFLYANAAGRFRFSTVCVRIDDFQAHFRIPDDVRTIADFGAKRGAVRIESLLPAQWRYAPGGQGNGDFAKGSISDLSRGGASLTVARELKVHAHIEVAFSLSASIAPFVLLCEVMRATKIETSNKSLAGIRFLNADAATANAIGAFINERHAMRRERGVV